MGTTKARIAVAWALCCGAVSLSYAATTQGCPTHFYKRSVATLAHARANWPMLQRHQSRFIRCDDGELAEGYSDAVVELLANKRKGFGQFAATASTHPDFFGWAVKHIDASASQDSLIKVVANASSCVQNPSLSRFCTPVLQAAQEALKTQVPGTR